MKSKSNLLKRLFLIFIFICATCSYASGEILFQDNFDDHPDWSPLQKTGSAANTTQSSDPALLPNGYDYFMMDGSSYSDKGENTININSSQHMGPTGKAFIFYAEMDRNCGAWCSDGILGIPLPGGEAGYDEIYIRFYVKFMKNYKWGIGDVGLKMLHVAHHKQGDSKLAFFSYTENKPRNFFKIYHVKNNDGLLSGPMGNPTYSIFTGDSNPRYAGNSENEHGYFPGATYGGGTSFHDDTVTYRNNLISKYGAETIVTDPNTPYPQFKAKDFPHGMVGDGEWHCWEWRLKMNTSANNADGICTFWQDGIKVYEATDIQWVASGDPASRRWNYIWLGGNNNNIYSEASEEEQWYALDDIIISTNQVGTKLCNEIVNLTVPGKPGVAK